MWTKQQYRTSDYEDTIPLAKVNVQSKQEFRQINIKKNCCDKIQEQCCLRLELTLDLCNLDLEKRKQNPFENYLKFVWDAI